MSLRPYVQRPAAPRCRGGASSVLRLSSVTAGRWPSATALTGWAERLTNVGDAAPAPMVAAAADADSKWFTRLMPTAN